MKLRSGDDIVFDPDAAPLPGYSYPLGINLAFGYNINYGLRHIPFPKGPLC